MLRTRALLAALFALALSLLAACGGTAPATLADVPTYPDTTLLKPGENPMADSLAQNVQMAGSMGQKLEQQMYTLPASASWDQVKGFYSDKLGAAGWKSTDLPAMAANEMFQLSVYTRGTQSLTVAQLVEPISKDAFLLFSLSSQ